MHVYGNGLHLYTTVLVEYRGTAISTMYAHICQWFCVIVYFHTYVSTNVLIFKFMLFLQKNKTKRKKKKKKK